MASIPATSSHKPRETRINVVVPARLRLGAKWSDACILNVSARGLLIHSREPAERGSYVELRRGDQVIVGRVMWQSGPRIGLRSQDRVPVEAIVTSKASEALRLCASPGQPVERRKVRRAPADSRLRGRAMQFISTAVIAASLSLAVISMVVEAVAEPLSRVKVALSG
jgi:hypothetical protein